MFTSGQLIFAGLFVVVFTTAIFISYKKDTKLHLKNYKGVKWIALAFLIFILILFVIKYFIKN